MAINFLTSTTQTFALSIAFSIGLSISMMSKAAVILSYHVPLIDTSALNKAQKQQLAKRHQAMLWQHRQRNHYMAALFKPYGLEQEPTLSPQPQTLNHEDDWQFITPLMPLDPHAPHDSLDTLNSTSEELKIKTLKEDLQHQIWQQEVAWQWRFKQHLAWLSYHNYQVWDLQQLAQWQQSNTPLPEKVVVLYFAKPTHQLLHYLPSLLEEYGFRASIGIDYRYIEAHFDWQILAKIKRVHWLNALQAHNLETAFLEETVRRYNDYYISDDNSGEDNDKGSEDNNALPDISSYSKPEHHYLSHEQLIQLRNLWYLNQEIIDYHLSKPNSKPNSKSKPISIADYPLRFNNHRVLDLADEMGLQLIALKQGYLSRLASTQQSKDQQSKDQQSKDQKPRAQQLKNQQNSKAAWPTRRLQLDTDLEEFKFILQQQSLAVSDLNGDDLDFEGMLATPWPEFKLLIRTAVPLALNKVYCQLYQHEKHEKRHKKTEENTYIISQQKIEQLDDISDKEENEQDLFKLYLLSFKLGQINASGLQKPPAINTLAFDINCRFQNNIWLSYPWFIFNKQSYFKASS